MEKASRSRLIVENIRDQLKLRYFNLDYFPIYQLLHIITPLHFTQSRLQITSRYILMSVAGFQYRLLSRDAIPLHQFDMASCVGDFPPSAKQLNRDIAVILNVCFIGEDIMLLVRPGELGLIYRVNTYFYTFRYGSDH